MRTVALIPLRGGSKGVPEKNIKLLNNKPLCAWVIESACKTNLIDEVYISTDSEKIHDVVLDLGLKVKILKRSDDLSTDEATTEAVVLDFMKRVPFDVLVTIQATSPLLQSEDLTMALKNFRQNGFDSMISVNMLKQFLWNKDGTPYNYDPRKRPRRQEISGEIIENGSFYISKRETIKKTSCRIGGKIGFYKMSPDDSHEIDEFIDFEIAATYLNYRKNKKNK